MKDVIDVAGTRTTAASRVLADNVPDRDAYVVARLRAAGAILLGKLNLHEFAYGALTTSPHFGPARNPWSLERSLRRLERRKRRRGRRRPGCRDARHGHGGLHPHPRLLLRRDRAAALDRPRLQPGRRPGRLELRHGRADRAHGRGLRAPPRGGRRARPRRPVDRPRARASLRRRARAAGSSGLRIGVVTSLVEGADPRIGAAVEAALEELRSLGAGLTPVAPAMLAHAGTIQQAMQFQEAAEAHLEWLRTRLSDYGDDVRARLLVGLVLPSTLYVTGQRARRVAYEELRRTFERVDVLAAPTMPVLPPRIGEETVELDGREVPYRIALIPYNSPWSLVGSPVVSVPCGFVEGLPAGLALVGPRLGEATVLRAAHAFQEATDWHERQPSLL